MAITSNTLRPTQRDLSISSAFDCFPITKSDTDYIADPDDATRQISTKGLSTDVTGTIKVTTMTGRDVPVYLVAGVIHPMNVIRVWDTGTTAPNVVGWR